VDSLDLSDSSGFHNTVEVRQFEARLSIQI